MPSPDSNPEALLPLQPAAFHVLVALADHDQHGYAIMRDVSDRTGGKLTLNPGTLYTTIRRLLDQGLITERAARPAAEHDDERRRYYGLTTFGRRVARAEAARLEQLLSMAREAGLMPKRS